MPAGMKGSSEGPPVLSFGWYPVRRQVLFGLPLLRLPSGVYCRAMGVMLPGSFLSKCPIHLHLLLMMMVSMLCWRQYAACLSHTLSSYFKVLSWSWIWRVQDFHLPVTGYLPAFNTVIHWSIFGLLWKPITSSCFGSFCCCFRNKRLFTGLDCKSSAQPPNLEGQWITFLLISTLRPVLHEWPLQLPPAQLSGSLRCTSLLTTIS